MGNMNKISRIAGGETNDPMLNEINKFRELSESLLADEKTNPVSRRVAYDNLREKLDIGLSQSPIDDDAYYDILNQVVLATPKTSSKLFFNQLFGGRQPKAVLGELLAVILNNSMATYKISGVQVGIEKEIIRQVVAKLSYPSSADGTFAAGGSMCNFMAMLMARDKTDQAGRFDGVRRNLVAYTCAEAHYSVEKNASFIGVGRNNVRKISSDARGRMIADELDRAIAKDIEDGNIPFFVNATAGTTVLGAFDPFADIADIAKKHDVWFHIDGAYSGVAMFSRVKKKLLAGAEYSDSFSFNAHKTLGTPLSCSIIVVRDRKYLQDSFSNSAEYLYQTDEDELNLGKTSFQCARRNDALKFWALWKSVGTDGLEEIVDRQFDLASYALDYVKSHPDYTVYSYEDSVSICFNYKDIPAKELCTALYEQNELMVGFGKFRDDEFVRLVTVNSTMEKGDIQNFFKVLEEFADRKFGGQ